ncbi:putative secreted protein (Por secretion system target) [Oceanihabitans sediminis]|uniref:T9SS C-terminal target domain-containing protein n=1 Tax=Oceanihabitans sediminis TaxID=1812012 RepID=A0A368P7H6_9FLAO|nr:choice-of-anchor J domain-containing protein [Oceanihabitans sediminis]RBP32710.1 putative secreted protein (Por secretion system target) [Oceanihabitans sediminis]RCU57749.1 T9SS C-terminal target domain-containing protein [Oceanihabitans sediminis]
MKKITFLLFAMLAFSWQSKAQFTESFDTEIPATWTIVDVDGGDTWEHITTNNYLGAGHAYIKWDSNAHDDYLITPQFDVTAGVSDQISFWAAISSGWTETFEVRLSTTGTAPADFTELLGSETATVDVSTYEKFTYNLSAYVGTQVYIAIRATDTDRFYLHIDEFVNDAAPTCTPTVVDSSTVVDNCGASQFSIDLVVSTEGDGTVVSDGTNTFPIVAGTVTAGPYTIGETVTLTVQHSDGACDFSLGDFNTACTLPGEVCENAITVGSLPYTTTDNTVNYGDDYSSADTPCSSNYMNGDDVFYSFTPAVDMSVNIATSGTGSWTGLFVFEECPLVTCVASDTQSGGNPSLPNVDLVGGTTYYIAISTYPSPQSTAYTLDITENTCSPVTASYNVVSDCDVSGGFYIDVNVTDMGSATALTVSDDQASPSQALTAAGTLQFGPYVNGTDVIITIDDDNDDDSCTVTSSAITQSVCPPANDECINAIELTVNGDDSCTVTTSGTIAAATASGEDESTCFGTENDDVWFSFTATNESHLISILNKANSPSDLYHSVWSGSCGTLTNINCSDPDSSTANGLTIGETYFVRVNSYSSNSGAQTTFDICVGTPPPPPSNIACATATPIACGETISGTSAGSTGNQEGSGCTMGSNGVWYTFTGYGGDIIVTVDASFDHELAITSGTCGALVNVGCKDSSSGQETYTITDSVDGETYYVYIAHWSGSGTTTGTHTINIECPTASIDDFEASNGLSYYPNPVNNTLTLNAKQNIDGVAVYNMLGQEVLHTAPNTVNTEVNMSALGTGAYFVKVTIGNATETVRIIKN